MHKFSKAVLIALILIASLLFLSGCRAEIEDGRITYTFKVKILSPSSSPTPSTNSEQTEENEPEPKQRNDAETDPNNLNLRKVAAKGVQDIVKGTKFAGKIFGRGPRPDNPNSDHPSGMAADFDTSSKAEGDRVAEYCRKNAKRLKVKYVLWQVEDHFGHVHVSFKEG